MDDFNGSDRSGRVSVFDLPGAVEGEDFFPQETVDGFGDDEVNEAIRLSGCHLTPKVDWDAVAARILSLR